MDNNLDKNVINQKMLLQCVSILVLLFALLIESGPVEEWLKQAIHLSMLPPLPQSSQDVSGIFRFLKYYKDNPGQIPYFSQAFSQGVLGTTNSKSPITFYIGNTDTTNYSLNLTKVGNPDKYSGWAITEEGDQFVTQQEVKVVGVKIDFERKNIQIDPNFDWSEINKFLLEQNFTDSSGTTRQFSSDLNDYFMVGSSSLIVTSQDQDSIVYGAEVSQSNEIAFIIEFVYKKLVSINIIDPQDPDSNKITIKKDSPYFEAFAKLKGYIHTNPAVEP